MYNMKEIWAILLMGSFSLFHISASSLTAFSIKSGLPEKSTVIARMKLVNNYWIANNPSPGNNQWARSAYFTGCMEMYKNYPDDRYLNYMKLWASNNNWSLNGGNSTRNADNQTCGQVYYDLFKLEGSTDSIRIRNIKASIDNMVAGSKQDDWWWVDALYMSMPVFARMYEMTGDSDYLSKMHSLYTNTKTERSLFNTHDSLWFRDQSFKPPYLTPQGQNSYWGRGNGWVIAAHVRILQYLPRNYPDRTEYMETFRAMASALKMRQRTDGFWNCSLNDPLDYGGPETSGTSFFTYALAWGINQGILDSVEYLPTVLKAWDGLTLKAVQSNGFLGYVQGVGSNPSSSQPVTAQSTADFGVGAFLLAGSEVLKLSTGEMPQPSNFFLKELKVLNKNEIHLRFSKKLNRNTAEDTGNYSGTPAIPITDINMANQDSSVMITTGDILPGNYGLVIDGLLDIDLNVLERDTIGFVYTGLHSITASGHEPNSGNTPDKAIDFDLNTRWSSDGSGQWIQFDLGNKVMLDGVQIAFYKGDQRRGIFKILLSESSSDSIEVYNGRSSGRSAGLETYHFIPQYARFVRIVGYGNTVSSWNSITEVRFNTLSTSFPEVNPDNISIFTDPANRSVLKIKGISFPGNFRIYDLSGKSVNFAPINSFMTSNFTSSFENYSTNTTTSFVKLVTDIVPGVYFLKMEDKNIKFIIR